MPVWHNPFFRLIALAAAAGALLYMPTREFLKLTFMMGIPFILLLGFNRRQQRWGVKWCLSALLLLAVTGAYGYFLTELPERIEVRRIISEGGALVAEGHYDQAINEYRKLADLGREKKMQEKIAQAEDEKHAALSLQRGKQLLSQGNKEEALQVLESIPGDTRAGKEAIKLIAAINKGES
ncbi:MAG TPA: tetratricopeptide repeat protein [Syntrophomonadaceae bacterium]|nr:tetratricopeptide repeat protein [Syntrophomonadaceae bacterium]HQE23948.1 tetratricopeptide repeat protein [Syntrophomonadaceae bacterium]